MTFSLYVDEDRWRTHLSSVVAATPGIVPVIKGNGYGLGNARLAAVAETLDVPAVAVGTSDELPAVAEHFGGDILVMSPSYPEPEKDSSGKVIRTVAHLDALRAGGGGRVVVEAMTSMRRHGLPAGAVAEVAGLLGGVQLEGLAFHLPIDRHGGYDAVAEVAMWLDRFADNGVPTTSAWVAHLSGVELDQLRARHPATTFRPRVGTSLWLGDRGALVA